MDATVVPGYTRLGYARAPPRLRRAAAHGRPHRPRHRRDERSRPRGRRRLRPPARGILVLARDSLAGHPRRGRDRPRHREHRRPPRRRRPQRPRLAPTSPPRTSPAGWTRWTSSFTTPARCRPQRTLSPDGIELTFATNVVGPFALTALLDRPPACGRLRAHRVGLLRRHVRAVARRRRPADLAPSVQGRRRLRADEARADRADRAVVAPARRPGLTAHAMHPGLVDTLGIEASLPRFHKLLGSRPVDAAEGADTIVWRARREAPLSSRAGSAPPARAPDASPPRHGHLPRGRRTPLEACQRLTCRS